MHLDYFENIDNFYPALKTLFKDLNIPVNYIAEEPARPRDILTNTFKEANPAFKLMEDVYFLGMVDDAAFEGNKSPDTSEIKSDYDGLLLFGVTLKERGNGLLPTRSHLAEITRAFNREFHYTPVVVVFRYNQYIAFANAERQKYKQEWREGEKAGKVSLLRDVKVKNPHTGHLKILQELTITRTGRNAVNSFDGLYKYWQEVFNVSVLNREFYKELSNWYFWALKNVTFPGAPIKADQNGLFKEDERVKEHNAKNLIRLLTRLLFVWFVKEKKLIPEELFDTSYIKEELLKEFHPQRLGNLFDEQAKGSTYYKAVLQNLFFATLNQTMGKREFRKDKQHMNVTNLMRYKNYFKDPGKFIKLVEDIVPFMNGGLFECLDQPDPELKGKRGGDVIIYQDGFSDRNDNKLVIPDYIFFGTKEPVDLSEDYGSKNKACKEAPVRGLINILNSYKFTITENTPIEEDVALDPELLGRVFENLLASYNPETKTTARKQTGSFYTPREIVNYMVDESLIAYFKNKLSGDIEDADELDTKLHQLISFDNIQPFQENKTKEKIIKAIDACSILDPACGSGAFPMGILQKMVHLLHKLDPGNEQWKQRQIDKVTEAIEKAEEIEDSSRSQSVVKELKEQIEDIEDSFENNELDYGRKLYLLENCIYGVDIQPIAAQISKLRFFISLIVDQSVDKNKENFGIRPLPNLETKFVAANTLIGIEKPKEQGELFDNPEIKKLENSLKKVRHKLFSSKSPGRKRELRDEDKTLREQIAELLIDDGWENKTARQLASWDPYDQNASSPFFDPEWMFDIRDGFDVVIGNPPYIGERKNKHKFYNIQSSTSAKYYLGRMDYFYFFFHLGLDFLKSKGICTLITTNYFLTALGARKLRKDIQSRSSVLSVINFNEAKVFDSAAGQHNMITILLKTNSDVQANISIVRSMGLLSSSELKSTLERRESSIQHYKLKQSELWDGEESYLRLSGKGSKALPINYILDTLVNQSTDLLGNICSPLIGLESSLDKIYVASKDFFNEIIESNDELSHIKPFFKNSDISRYKIKKQTDRYILYLHEKILNIHDLKGIYKYLKRNESLIKGRKGANLRGAYKRDNWWVLNTPRLDMDFEDDKIVTPYRSKTLRFAFTKEPWYASRDVYYIVKKKTDISLKYILCLLNSKLYYIWLYNRGKRKGEMLELYAQPLKEIPIKEISKLEQEKFIFLANILSFAYLKLEKYSEVFEKITDALVCELYFLDHMKEKQIDILKFVEQDLKETLGKDNFEQLPDEQKENVIEELHKRWSDPDSEIVKRMNSFAEKSPDILKPILESK